jgi:NAD-binding of NADP-dependent 3-hydroxyisobutyrate dehydrogenase
MLKGDYPTAFPLKHQQKDLRLVLELADSVSQPLPVAAAANSLFEQVRCRSNVADVSFAHARPQLHVISAICCGLLNTVDTLRQGVKGGLGDSDFSAVLEAVMSDAHDSTA